MNRPPPPRPAPAPAPPARGAAGELRAWADALVAVAAGCVAMFAVAAAGLWAAGARALPAGAFPAVLAATLVAAVGGTLELSGDVGFLGGSAATLEVVPLSVTVAGALATGVVFLLPLRHRAVAGGGELLARAARTAVVWLVALAFIAGAARFSFRVRVGQDFLDELGAALDITPTVGFHAPLGSALGHGALWLLGVLVVAVAVSRGTPLPRRLLRLQGALRPPAFAMVVVLLGYVVLGLVIGLVTAFTHDDPSRTAAILLLGLPNLAWMAFGVGLGGAWEGRVPGDIGLPVPHALAAVLRGNGRGTSTVDLAALSEQDGRAWVLAAVAGLALLTAGLLTAFRSPAGTPAWRVAVRLGVVAALTLLVVGLATEVSARYGLAVLGLGDLTDFGGEVRLWAHLGRLVGLGLLWGLVAGFTGGLCAKAAAGRRLGRAEAADGQGPGAGGW
ncbi:streptophobe family protein [Streptomyces mashuensis]|uniref:streptophobe family protein n=1 Tax=Streptomyces mashuensis TaxID=33904 RepID=UPI001E41436C|nr:streptophobe family protein [Streptomyces mashuensis]